MKLAQCSIMIVISLRSEGGSPSRALDRVRLMTGWASGTKKRSEYSSLPHFTDSLALCCPVYNVFFINTFAIKCCKKTFKTQLTCSSNIQPLGGDVTQ